jgi:integrase
MKFRRQRYQKGSVRKVPRSHGFAWEFRYRYTDDDGRRREKVQTFDSSAFGSEFELRKAMESQMSALNDGTLRARMDATFGDLISKYLKEELPKLKSSTQSTNTSMAKLHVQPRWGNNKISEVDAYSVDEWLTSLHFGQASKVRARNMMKRLFDLAMLWKYIPFGRNPMDLVKVKRGSKRLKKIVIVTPKQFKCIVGALPEPYNLMVLLCGCLGLRVSEALAIEWRDIDWKASTIGIKQIYTHSRMQDSPKTNASESELPIYPALARALRAWRKGQDDTEDFPFVFSSPRTGRPYSADTIRNNYLKPAALKLGISGFGWHSIRHSYKSWMAAAKINPAHMRDLMRHSDITTTMDVYGNTLTPELRKSNSLVARQLF